MCSITEILVKKILESLKNLLAPIYENIRTNYMRVKLRSKSVEDIFTDISKSNTWSGKDSISGVGSDFEQTITVIEELPKLFKDFDVFSILDIPCGDFNWMKKVNLNGFEYIGADIVEKIIQENNKQCFDANINFIQMNLIGDSLPKVNLVLCRDCLVHFSYADILLALKNICASDSEYLLTTTFIERKKNKDIPTGHWRVLNMQIYPFFFPAPLKILNEGCTEGSGDFCDKSLGLWRIKDIKECLTKSSVF